MRRRYARFAPRQSSDRDEVAPPHAPDAPDTMEQTAERRGRALDRLARLEDAFGVLLLCVVATYIVSSLVGYHDVGAVVITFLCSLTVIVALASAKAGVGTVVWGRRAAWLAVVAAVVAVVVSSGTLLGLTA